MVYKTDLKVNVLSACSVIYTFVIAFSGGTGSILVQMARLLLVAGLCCNLIIVGNFKPRNAKHYYIWSIVFMLYSVVSIFWAVNSQTAMSTSLSLFYVIVANVVVAYATDRKPDLLWSIIKASIWGAFFHGARIYCLYGPTVYFSSRGGSGVENAVVLGYVAPIAAILSFILVNENKTNKKEIYKILCVMNIIFAILTGSKKSLLYIGLFFVVYFILKTKNPLFVVSRIMMAIAAVAVAAYLVMKIPFLYDLVGYRFETMIGGFLGESTDASTSFRLKLVTWGMEWFSEKPVWGHGIGCFKYLVGSTYDTWRGLEGIHAHNNYVELLVDGGVIGTVLYYSLYVGIIVRMLKLHGKRQPAIRDAVCLIVSLAINEYGQTAFSNAYLQEIILIAWLLSTPQYNTKKETELAS